MKKVEAARIRLASKHATKIRNAMKASFNVSQIVDDWFSTHPAGGETTTDEARTWAKIHIRTDSQPLNKVLRFAYADAYELGIVSATAKYAHAIGFKKADTPSNGDMARAVSVNWDTWKPGNKAAAALLNPPNGLAKLLDSRMTTISSIDRTSWDRLGIKLRDGLNAGLSKSNMANSLENVINDPERAQMIAVTEMARATSVANRDLYETSGVEYVEWLVAEGCDECKQNADASPIPIDATFPSGDSEPPAHPNCMCDLAPYVVDTQGMDAQAIDDSVTPIDDTGDTGSEVSIPDYGTTADFQGTSLNELIHNANEIYNSVPDRNGYEDYLLKEIYKYNGYDGLPQLFDKPEFDKLADTHIISYRGMAGAGDKAEQFVTDFKTGSYYAGNGVYGNGTYSSSSLKTALSYADGLEKNVVSIGIPSDYKFIQAGDLNTDLYDKFFSMLNKEEKIYRTALTEKVKAMNLPFEESQKIIEEKLQPWKNLASVTNNGGRFAALFGYDGIEVEVSTGEFSTPPESYYILLNRSKLAVLK